MVIQTPFTLFVVILGDLALGILVDGEAGELETQRKTDAHGRNRVNTVDDGLRAPCGRRHPLAAFNDALHRPFGKNIGNHHRVAVVVLPKERTSDGVVAPAALW